VVAATEILNAFIKATQTAGWIDRGLSQPLASLFS
jgi:hypothetical protein